MKFPRFDEVSTKHSPFYSKKRKIPKNMKIEKKIYSKIDNDPKMEVFFISKSKAAKTDVIWQAA